MLYVAGISNPGHEQLKADATRWLLHFALELTTCLFQYNKQLPPIKTHLPEKEVTLEPAPPSRPVLSTELLGQQPVISALRGLTLTTSKNDSPLRILYLFLILLFFNIFTVSRTFPDL